MAVRTELHMRLPNSPGAFADVCRTLGEARVHIVAFLLEPTGNLRMVVDNPLQASAVLRDRHHRVDQHEIIYTSVSRSPGALAAVLQLAADAHLNVEYAYCGEAEADGLVGVALGVADPRRAAMRGGM